MTDITANISIWNVRADSISLEQNSQAPKLFRLQLCNDVGIILDRDAADIAGQAAAMRELARLATEAAEDLEKAAARDAEARDGQG
jgi:hypothetical protein